MHVSFDSLESIRLSPERAAHYASLAVHDVRIAIGRATIAVRFSHAVTAAAFAKRFGDTLGHDEPVAIAYAVAGADDAHFWVAADRARRWPLPITDELAVFFADNLAMHEYLTNSSDLGFHAAVVGNGSAVAALVGTSTAGKTTTAVAAVRRGMTIYSDERCIVQDGMVVPFLRAITIRDGGRALLVADVGSETPMTERLRALAPGREAALLPSDLFGDRAGGPPCRLGAIFSIDGRNATPSVEACSIYELLPTLLRSMASRDRGIERATRIIATLRDVSTFRLRLGTPDASAAAIARTLRDVNDARR